MTMHGLLLAATWITPLALMIACLNPALRAAWRVLLPLAPLPALLAALLVPDGTAIRLSHASYGLTFVLDRPATLLLGGAALLWIAAGVYAGGQRREDTDARFVVWWLATMTGSLGVFIAADLYAFYLFFTIVSLAAYWLVVADESPEQIRAGRVYVAFALLGEAFLLLAFVILAASAPGHSLLIADAVAAIPSSPWRDAILMLIVLGFGVKIGLVPLHVWMPPTYTAAPVTVAAVLSGAAVKAGVIGLIRFLPFDAPLTGFGHALAAAGFVAAFTGVAIGLTQRNPKTVLAYSSISQMGVIASVMGMGLAGGLRIAPLLAAFYALHHILVKGGLFLAIGIAARGGLRSGWPVLLPAAIIALALGGLPLTGGALAKLAVKPVLGDGVASLLSSVSAAGSTILMMHFLYRLRLMADSRSETASGAAIAAWLAVAISAIALPWALYPAATQGNRLDALSAAALWETSWPALAGIGIALVLFWWRIRLPSVLPGDLIALGPGLVKFAQRLGDAMANFERTTRSWPAAGVAVLLLVILLMGVTVVGK